MLSALLARTEWQTAALPADGADIYRISGMPPEDELLISREEGCLEVLFCREGRLTLELAGNGELHLSPGQVLFLPGRTGNGRCRFARVPFSGILVREDERAALAALSSIWPDSKPRMPESSHGCGCIDASLWCEALFVSLEQLPPKRQGNYCAIKVLELLYLLHSGSGHASLSDQRDSYDQYQIQSIRRIHDYMLEHLEQRMTIRDLSMRFHISATSGAVVEEGSCVLRVTHQSGQGHYDKIVAMIEQSEQLKSAAENQAARLADCLVPYTLAGSALVYLLTRNVTRALSVLMVDFSCALKLSMPLAVLSAMGEASRFHTTVKGGKYLETIARADTVIFDKTGTLTYASPTVARVIPFAGQDENEMLRLAACLEEHFPHSMANAVVQAARIRGLAHEEMHTQVEYLVAHGIVSTVEGQRVIIGSAHFVFEDEGCSILPEEQSAFDALPGEYSHLFLAVGGVLAAVICIFDPLRAEAAAAISALRWLGVKKLVMLTDDSERTASVIARQVGVDEYLSEVLPQDKALFVQKERENGHTVVMVGDGINDSPALSAAHAGIAVSDGAAIAREIADITIASDDLFQLVKLRELSLRLMRRIHSNYRFVIGFNGSLIALGAAGILPPATSAMLHNLSTLGVSLRSMTELLPPET